MKFSKEQRLAIAAPLEPGLIVAGAGTGKTTVMVERVSHLVLSEDLKPEEILGLTFTNKAAGEFKERTIKRLRAEKIINANVDISTYHSFAHNLLLNHGLRIGIDSLKNILSDSARAQFAYKIISKTKLPLAHTPDSLATVVNKVIKLDNELAEHDIEIETLNQKSQEFIERVISHGGKQDIEKMAKVAQYRMDLASLVGEFREAKAQMGYIDFADQLRYALLIVRNHSQVVQELRETYRAVLLDEYQDTSVTQRILMTKIFGEGHPITAVGDPLQAIYGWRGAAVSNIEQYKNHFKKIDGSSANIYYLTTNYRSGNNILKIANTISEPLKSKPEKDQELIAVESRKDQALVKIALLEKSSDEINQIVEQIKDLRKSHSLSKIAILGRTAAVLQEIYGALVNNQIPATFAGTRDLLKVPAVSELLAYLKIIEDPSHNPSLIRILTGPRFQISLRDIKLLADRAKKPRAPFVEEDLESLLADAVSGFDIADLSILSDALEDPGSAAYGDGVKEIFKQLNDELNHLRRFQSEPLGEFIYRVLIQTNLLVELRIESSDTNIFRQQSIEELLRLANHFSRTNEDVSLSSFLSWIQTSEDLNESINYRVMPAKDSVTLITVHSAKGLQWPIVFLPSIVKGAFPMNRTDSWIKQAQLLPYWIRQDGDTLNQLTNLGSKSFDDYEAELKNGQMLEERRLMYVAVTRAEDQLFVSGHNWGPTQKNVRGASKFLDEIKPVVDLGVGIIEKWHQVESDESNPNLESPISYGWPEQVSDHKQQQRLAAVDLISIAESFNESELELTAIEKQLVAYWDQSAEFLLKEIAEQTNPVKRVRVPTNLNVTKTIELTRDSKRFALRLLRPMPNRPFVETKRGTQFHLWVENHYKHRTLWDPFDLPGSEAMGVLTDQDLKEMQDNFHASEWSKLSPIALEWDFDLKIANRYIKGRIDAIFKINNRVVIVDWKTGKKANSDQLQLAIYRAAWSLRHQTPLEEIDAAFVYIPSMEIQQPAKLPDLAEIEQLIINA
jgi:DNA helicase II / ATP-dependent DNA helicase PcrA